jgi:hypothetical protein
MDGGGMDDHLGFVQERRAREQREHIQGIIPAAAKAALLLGCRCWQGRSSQ